MSRVTLSRAKSSPGCRDKVKSVEVVQRHHVEGRCRGALLFVSAHVEVVVIRASVGQPMNEPWIAVLGKDDGTIGREYRVELPVREAVGMLACGLKAHQIDGVDEANLE